MTDDCGQSGPCAAKAPGCARHFLERIAELRAEVEHWRGAAKEHAEACSAARTDLAAAENALRSAREERYRFALEVAQDQLDECVGVCFGVSLDFERKYGRGKRSRAAAKCARKIEALSPSLFIPPDILEAWAARCDCGRSRNECNGSEPCTAP